VIGFGRKRRPERSWEAVHASYLRAQESGQVPAEADALRALIAIEPDRSWPYFDLGLLHKWARDWDASARLNAKALELSADEPENPAAWNLGIAATAVGDWATARRAWAAYGIELPGESGPILGSFGQAPIRLNAEPRHRGEQPLLIDGRTWQTEVVWADRLSPASAIIRSIPFPESGHRFGDVVLHDGEPVGERVVDGQPRAVFNEITLLEVSPVSTWAITVTGAGEGDWEALRDLAMTRGGSAENWTTGTQMLCRACSEGSPGEEHVHQPAVDADEQRLGLAVPAEDVDWVMDTWTQGRSLVRIVEAPERVL
jgi:hypothetical protein